MTPEHDKELCDKYPKIFKNRNAPKNETNIAYGFQCGDGWFNLIDELCRKIQEHCDSIASAHTCRQVVATQVKEKFGCLRFYTNNSCSDVDQIIYDAEVKSQKICEVCGEEGKIISKGGWLMCRCPEHENGSSRG